ncbi:MAG: hypothetical protein ACTSX6_02155 [Candidatus Heimdallarchaeaceae archaeon]
MRGTRIKHLKRLVAAKEPILLMTIRQHYGKRTEQFQYRQILQAAKKLYHQGELDDLISATRGIRDLPTLRSG